MSSHWSSLRLRLALVVLVASLPVFAAMLSASQNHLQSEKKHAASTLRSSSDLLAAHEKRLLADTHGILAALAANPRLAGSGCRALLLQVLPNVARATNLGVIDPRGSIVCSAKGRTFMRSGGQSLLRNVDLAHGFATTVYERSEVTQQPIITVGFPLHDGGAVFASISADWLKDAVTPATVPGDGRVVLVSNHGTVMARVPDPDHYTGRRLPSSPVVRAAIAARSLKVEPLLGVDKVPRVWALRPLGTPDAPTGHLAIGLAERSLYGEAEAVFRRTLLLGTLGALAAGVASWVVATRLVRRPVRDILAVTTRLQHGDLTARVSAAGSGELAALGAGIDGMAESLAARAAAARAAQHEFTVAFHAAPIGILVVSDDGSGRRSQQGNEALARLLGRTSGELAATRARALVHPDDRSAAVAAFRTLAHGHLDDVTLEMRLLRRDGETVWGEVSLALSREPDGRTTLIAQIADITDRRAARERLEHIALHDQLTGLANRTLVSDRIEQAMRRSRRTRQHYALLFVDLDRFKMINDSLGHEAGDAVLARVASRVAAAVRPTDTAARLGGDEFVVLCESLGIHRGAAERQAVALAERVAKAIASDVDWAGRRISVGASVGVSVPVLDGQTVDEVLRDADLAMYRAKTAGGAQVVVADRAAQEFALSSVDLEVALRDSIPAVSAHYQPIVDLTTRQPVAWEALARWAHPTRGEVPPTEFIPVAEQSGLIVGLGDRMLDLVTSALGTRRPQGPPLGHVHVNVSAVQLARSDLADTLLRLLDQRSCAPDRVSVEITESTLLDVTGRSLAQLLRLRDAGVRLGIDDFGTGYASLAALRRLPVGFVKIDRSFVGGMVRERSDCAVVRSVISLAEDLGLEVVAEGIETEAQAKLLGELGCRLGQGWLLGRPAALVAAAQG